MEVSIEWICKILNHPDIPDSVLEYLVSEYAFTDWRLTLMCPLAKHPPCYRATARCEVISGLLATLERKMYAPKNADSSRS